MKKTFFILFLLAFSLISLRAQSEENVIRKVIQDETIQFHTNLDRKVFLSYWNITDKTIMMYSGSGGTTRLTGTQMNEAAKNGIIPKADEAVASYEDFVIKVDGNVAWASFIQQDTRKDGTKSAKLQEFRMMEKVNGVWKITSASNHELK